MEFLLNIYEDAVHKLAPNRHFGRSKPNTSDILGLDTDVFPGEMHYVYRKI